jgi:hypothetical protein
MGGVPAPSRVPAATAAVLALLTAATAFTGLVFLGVVSLAPEAPRDEGTVFYVVPYHYGFAFYDRQFAEIEKIQVKEGETVALHIVPATALARETFFAYAERSIRAGIGRLAPGDPQIRRKIDEDLVLGDVEHIIGVSAHAVHVQTDVTGALGGRIFREGAPKSVREAVEGKDPSIKTVTFTAKKVGTFDVLCVDSGMDGGGTCGWGHQWMIAKGALVVREGD